MRSRPTHVTCTLCAATGPIPADRDHRPLWAAGWRWLDTLNLYSCPGCPAMVIEDSGGRHRAGPGIAEASRRR